MNRKVLVVGLVMTLPLLLILFANLGRDPGQIESPLIGKVRVVPIHRQNAVMILAAPEYRNAVRDIIMDELDKPGRQVMISAIIAEVSRATASTTPIAFA